MENHNPEDKPARASLSKTLDPDDWNEFRKLGHQMLDDICDHLSTLRDRPVWQAMPDEVKQHLIVIAKP